MNDEMVRRFFEQTAEAVIRVATLPMRDHAARAKAAAKVEFAANVCGPSLIEGFRVDMYWRSPSHSDLYRLRFIGIGLPTPLDHWEVRDLSRGEAVRKLAEKMMEVCDD